MNKENVSEPKLASLGYKHNTYRGNLEILKGIKQRAQQSYDIIFSAAC